MRPTHVRATALSFGLVGALLVALGTTTAAAQPTAPQPSPAAPAPDTEARALALYEEGTRLLDAGSTAAACPKLEEAVRLVPDASGAHLALGVCFERMGRLASALHHLERAEALADPVTLAQRRRRAREAAEALRPRVARITIVVEPTATPDQVVALDGRPVERGVASPVDAGTHAIVLTDRGEEITRRTIDVRDGDRARVVLAAPATTDPGRPPPSTPEEEGPDSAGDGPPWATIGAIGLAVGGAGLVLGAVGGAVAADRDAASAEECDERDFCTDAGFAARDEAFTWATVSTVGFIAGGALAATGLVLVLVGDGGDDEAGLPPPRVHAEAVIEPGGVRVRGTF